MAGNEAGACVKGHRHGSRTRSLTGTFGPIEIAVPRARLITPEGGTAEWKSQALRAYQRRTLAADALIASSYLAGTNTRRVRRALAALFGGTVGKDTVSRTWRKVKGDWDAWNSRSLAAEPIVRLILDGTVVRVRLDRKATSISLLVVLGVRADGQKVLLAIKSMGGESAEAWRTVLDDLIARGLRRPAFLMVDGAPGLDKAIAAVWDGVAVQRCTVHKHRNLLAHAPERLHDEITADYNDMIYATTPEEITVRRKAFIRKWLARQYQDRGQCLADSIQESRAGFEGHRRARGVGPSCFQIRTRDYRSCSYSGRRGGTCDPSSTARHRCSDRARRFRHRIFVAELSAAFPIRQNQDRPLFHQRHRRIRGIVSHRTGRSQYRRRAQHDDDSRRC